MRIRQFQVDQENNINAERCASIIDIQLIDDVPTLWAFCADEGEGRWPDQQFYALQVDQRVTLDDIQHEFVKSLINQRVAWFFFHVNKKPRSIAEDASSLEPPEPFNGRLS